MHREIETKKNHEACFLGWVDYVDTHKKDLEAAIDLGRKFQGHDVLVIIGIGGSFLGAKSIYELLKERKPESCKTELLFLGTDLSGLALKKSLKLFKGKRFLCECNFQIWRHFRTSDCFSFS